MSDWEAPSGPPTTGAGVPPSLPAPPAPPSPPSPPAGVSPAPPNRPTYSAPAGGFTPPPGGGSDNPLFASRVPDEPEGTDRSALWALLGIAALIAIAAVGFFLFRGGDDTPVARSTTDRADEQDSFGGGDDPAPDAAATPEPEPTPNYFADPVRPDSVAVDASSVWVSDAACGVVLKIDKGSEEVVGAVIVGQSASGVAVAGGSVWVGTRSEGLVVRVNPDTLQVTGSVPVPGSALGLTANGEEVWATDPLLGVVYRINARTSQLVDTFDVGFDPHHVAIGNGAAWVANTGDNTVSKIDTTGRGVDSASIVGSRPLHVELGAGSAWITNSADGAVARVNEQTGEIEAVIDVGPWPHALAFAGGSVWVGTEGGTFWQIDPSTNESTRYEGDEFTTIDTVVDGNDIWIADASGGSAVRFDAASGEVGSIVDLSEFGDCQTFRDEAQNPPIPPQDSQGL